MSTAYRKECFTCAKERVGGTERQSPPSRYFYLAGLRRRLSSFPDEEDEGDIGEEGEGAEVAGEEDDVGEPEGLREQVDKSGSFDEERARRR
jgi:hypothetical protein